MHRTRFWPEYDEEQVEAVAAVLRSGRVYAWTGPDVAAFEREFADHVGTAHAIAMANGTVTLDAALRALDLQPGDEVIVPSPCLVLVQPHCLVRWCRRQSEPRLHGQVGPSGQATSWSWSQTTARMPQPGHSQRGARVCRNRRSLAGTW